ncbi:MAG TPA: phosphoglucosamine mutase [Gammaproteobacteria bacterium]|nr:phosphoglucosamine mutase [Gammaproteobacteria bacterium]
MSKRLFGTDGIRGKVGEFPITADSMLKLGWAAGRVLARQGGKKVLIGKDTRLSGYMFESALEAGFSAAGLDIVLLGPMPTPGIAHLTRAESACAGIVISASHNPHHDNGIKFFSAAGEKLDDAAEAAIEAEFERPLSTVDSSQLGRAFRMTDARQRYVEFCKNSVGGGAGFDGLKLVLDCANGATYQVAPAVFSEFGASVTTIGDQPDGININVDCGSVYPARLQQAVLEQRAQVGIAFDGDGDRVIMVDEQGEVLDGDEILFIIARRRQQQGVLRGPVVGTLMSNFGLEMAFRSLSVEFHRAKVGDRYVLELLREHGGIVGGESSGHIICLDRTTTGDGIVSALQVLETMVETGLTLAELKRGMSKLPQHMINVPITRGSDVLSSPYIRQALQEVEAELANEGRVLLRPSGTEPVIRVMVEGVDSALVARLATQLADAVGEVASRAAVAVN